MAFGHAVERRGFSGDDDKIKGQKGDVDETLDGGVGDDVIIAFDGDDQVVGGDGEDDLSGGGGDDLVVGAIWQDNDGDGLTNLATENNGVVDAEDTFTQDDFSDDFNAEATFAENGEDTIWFYDDDPTDFEDSGVVDKIDFSDAIELNELDPNADEVSDFIVYNTVDGQIESAGDADEDWFTVYTDAGGTTADTVYIQVDDDCYMWDSTLDGGAGDWALVA